MFLLTSHHISNPVMTLSLFLPKKTKFATRTASAGSEKRAASFGAMVWCCWIFFFGHLRRSIKNYNKQHSPRGFFLCKKNCLFVGCLMAPLNLTINIKSISIWHLLQGPNICTYIYILYICLYICFPPVCLQFLVWTNPPLLKHACWYRSQGLGTRNNMGSYDRYKWSNNPQEWRYTLITGVSSPL